MPTISQRHEFAGVQQKIERLGLAHLVQDAINAVTQFELLVLEEKHKNGAAVVREVIDERFAALKGWTKTSSGDVDWVKCHKVNGTRVCIGVEVQMSARSDMLVVDVIHLRDSLIAGAIDVALIIVPSDRLAPFLTDRCPSFADAVHHVESARATDLPFLVIGIDHDGPGQPLPKRHTNQGR